MLLGVSSCILNPNVAARPEFNPPGGSYDLPINVTITSATPGATIHYTIDGGDPNPASAVYSGPVSISQTTTLKAKACREGWSDSATARDTYTIAPPPDRMVYVPGGTFTMGDTHGVGLPEELPTHSVTLDPFYIGKYEVTQAEWQAVMGSNPAHDCGVGYNYPVYLVSWYAVLKYCNLRSKAEGLNPVYSISGTTNPAYWGEVPNSDNAAWNAAICDWSANGYRLPTEAEWEYAARGATNAPDYLYSGSDEVDTVAWYWDNWGEEHRTTHAVGELAPNGIGAHDMSGNVWEWCWDWYSGDYYGSSPGVNPTGPGSGLYRLIRGGNWYIHAFASRVSFRGAYDPYYSLNLHGFRLCRAIN